MEDLKLMTAHVADGVQVKASGGVRTLEALLPVRDLGVTRIGTSSTQTILDEARRQQGLDPIESATVDASGY